MDIRSTSRLPYDLSVIGQGTWQLGADWGDVTEDQALAVLDAAYESGVRFFDTADVYGDGRSEQLIATYLRSRPSHGITVATKMGRRANPHTADHYTLDNFRRWTDRSRKNLGVDTLDLVQLHCPPSPVLDQETTYEWLDTLVAEDRIAHYGVSVETCAEALTAIAHPVSLRCKLLSMRSDRNRYSRCCLLQRTLGLLLLHGSRWHLGYCLASMTCPRLSLTTTTAPITVRGKLSMWVKPSRGFLSMLAC